MPNPVNKADQDQKANPVNDVKAECVGKGKDLKGVLSQFERKSI